jgi:hypothetical protein
VQSLQEFTPRGRSRVAAAPQQFAVASDRLLLGVHPDGWCRRPRAPRRRPARDRARIVSGGEQQRARAPYCQTSTPAWHGGTIAPGVSSASARIAAGCSPDRLHQSLHLFKRASTRFAEHSRLRSRDGYCRPVWQVPGDLARELQATPSESKGRHSRIVRRAARPLPEEFSRLRLRTRRLIRRRFSSLTPPGVTGSSLPDLPPVGTSRSITFVVLLARLYSASHVGRRQRPADMCGTGAKGHHAAPERDALLTTRDRPAPAV